MVTFQLSLLAIVLLASAVTVVNSIARKLEEKGSTLVYTFQAVLVLLLVINDIIATLDPGNFPYFANRTFWVYLNITFFLLYLCLLVTVAPNQKALNISIDILNKDYRLRIAYWLLFLVHSILSFVWTVGVGGFRDIALSILVVPLFAVVGIVIEIVECDSSRKRERRASAYVGIVCLLQICWQVFFALK